MAAKKGAIPLTESELIEELVKRLDDEDLSRAQVGKVIKAFKAEVADCLQSGYKVTLTGLLTITPSAKPGRKKGTAIKNPFKPDEKPRILKADEPDKFAVKAKASSSILKGFPSVRTNDGQELLKQLAPAKKKKATASKGK